METGAKTIGIVGVVLALLLFSAILIPIVSSSSLVTETTENEPTSSTARYDFGAAAIAFDGSGYTLNGEAISVPTGSNILAMGPYFFLERGGIKYYHDNMVDRYPTGSDATTPWTFTITARGAFTFTCGDVTLTGYSDPDMTVHRDPNGPMIRSTAETPFYVNSNSAIVAYMYTTYSLSSWSYYIGAPRDVIQMMHPINSNTYGYINGYLTFTETDRDGVFTLSGTIGDANPAVMYILVPLEYEQPVPGEGTFYTILNIIPVIVVIGIVMATIYVCIGRNY